MKRWSLSLPLTGLTLAEHEPVVKEAEQLGYTDAWSAEVDGTDAFTPLALTAAWTGLRVGTAIANVYTRGPLTLANHALSMAEIAPGRFVLGLGVASLPIVQRWNNIPFERPLQRTRDMVKILRGALAGERVAEDLPTLKVDGIRLSRPVPQPVPIYLAALREQMLTLAGEIGDGVILNWLSPEDVGKVVKVAKAAASKAGKDPDNFEVVARLFTFITSDKEQVQPVARRSITTYLNVPTYAMFHEWLGRGGELTPMWDAWKAGDRKAATANVPQKVIDDLIIHGTPDECRERIEEYVAAGITVPLIQVFNMTEPDPAQGAIKAMRALAPR
ncbi:MAG: LLM class F420-dependent oxidoreductase [Dehalococcoidia bacterium]